MCVNVEKILYLTRTSVSVFCCPQLPSFFDFSKVLHYYVNFLVSFIYLLYTCVLILL